MLSLSCRGFRCSPLRWRSSGGEPTQGTPRLGAGVGRKLGNGAVFTSSSLLALWCHGTQQSGDATAHSTPPKGLAKLLPLLSSRKISLRRWAVGPTLQVVQCQFSSGKRVPSAAAMAVCAPSSSAGQGSPAACPRAGVSSEEMEPPAQRPCHSPACGHGHHGQLWALQGGKRSRPTALLCVGAGCGLEGPCPLLGWGLWGHSQHPTQFGCRQGCCLLFPATELRARGGERTVSSYLAAQGPQLSDAAWRSSSLTWKGQRGGGCLAGRWCSLATSYAASQSTRGSPVPWQCSIPGYPGLHPAAQHP